MSKRDCAVLPFLLLVATLASCGPGPGPSPTPEPATMPPPPPVSTPAPSTAAAECQGRIAFVGRAGDEKDIFVVDADGSGLANVTNGDGPESSPSWSPSGDRILFARHVGNSDIYTIRPDGSGLVRLTEMPSREYAPAWSPDGSHVIFGSTSGYASEIMKVSAGGGEAVPLTDSVAHKPDFAWSPDGSHLAFSMLDSYNQGDVHLMPATGGEVTNLTQNPSHDCCVDWAPDGERLLFLSSRQGQGGGLLLAGSGTIYQATDLRIRAEDGSDTTASSEIVRPVTTVMPEPPRDIYVIDNDGGGLARLTNGAGNVKHASWSPVASDGGERIAFVSDRDGYDEIYVMVVPEGADAGSGALLRLTDSPDDDSYPTWSPDGNCIAFQSYSDGELRLYVVNSDGSGLTKLAGDVVSGSGPTWSP